MSSFQGGRNRYRHVLISGGWNRGVSLYTEVSISGGWVQLYTEVSSFQGVGIDTDMSSFQGVGIERFHCVEVIE